MPPNSLIVQLAISAEEFLRLYEGSARDVVARAENGSTVRFPARVLRPYVTHAGIQGRFRLSFDDAHRFVAIAREAR